MNRRSSYNYTKQETILAEAIHALVTGKYDTFDMLDLLEQVEDKLMLDKLNSYIVENYEYSYPKVIAEKVNEKFKGEEAWYHVSVISSCEQMIKEPNGEGRIKTFKHYLSKIQKPEEP